MTHDRIEKIADMVNEGVILADIGTDHALLPILLMKQGKCRRVYACDIAKGPLSFAKENIEKNGLSDFIQPVLSNGLENVPDEVDAIVIAGMGYLTASVILEKAGERLSGLSQIITEINRDWHLMRKWISEHHYTILDESFVHERNHDYVIISFNTNDHCAYTKQQIELGPVLMNQNDPEYLSYCQKQLAKFQAILEKSNHASASLAERCDILKSFLKSK